MLNRDALAAAVIAEVRRQTPGWIESRIRSDYHSFSLTLAAGSIDPQCWKLERREKTATIGPDAWIHRMRLAVPAGYRAALRSEPVALVYERGGAVIRIEFLS